MLYVQLYVQVLVHQSTCTSLLTSSGIDSWIPEGTLFSDMGLHQLKGIASTTRIFQVRAMWTVAVLLVYPCDGNRLLVAVVIMSVTVC